VRAPKGPQLAFSASKLVERRIFIEVTPAVRGDGTAIDASNGHPDVEQKALRMSDLAGFF
jgi:hypothetical protein